VLFLLDQAAQFAAASSTPASYNQQLACNVDSLRPIDLPVLVRLLSLLLILHLSCPCAFTQDAIDDEVHRWIADLASPIFTLRQAASQNLVARGAKAVPALEAVCLSSDERETVARALVVLGEILESRDAATSQRAEQSLNDLALRGEISISLQAKSTLNRWRMDLSTRTVERLKRLGASISQPTAAADGSPEVFLTIMKDDWKGTDSDLALLPNLGRIQMFRVDRASVGNEGLKFLEKCSSVKHILLEHTQVDGRGLETVARVPHLERLTIRGLATLDRQGIEKICEIITLHNLTLDGCRLTDEMLPSLANLKNLSNLDLSRTRISDKQIAVLAKLPKLTTLNLTGAVIHGDGIAGLAKAPALDTLNLRASKLDPKALHGIAKLTQLRYLILDEIDLSSADFAKLASMKGLRYLDLAKCQITDNNARSIGELTQATKILLKDNQVSSVVRDQINKQIPKAQIISY
jgi:hypothetical protein